MADQLYFSRDTKVFLELIDPNTGSPYSTTVVYEIPVLDGYSFSQATNTSEVTLNEMSDLNGNSRRARQMFTNSFNPAEWSFTTYVRPFKSASGGNAGEDGQVHAVEEALWAAMVGDANHSSSSLGSEITAIPTSGGATVLPGVTATNATEAAIAGKFPAGATTVNMATDTGGNGAGAVIQLTVTRSGAGDNRILTTTIADTGTTSIVSGGNGYDASDTLLISKEEFAAALASATGVTATITEIESVLDTDIVIDITSVASVTGKSFTGFTRNTSQLGIDFTNSNKSKLGTFNLYFKLGQSTNTIYKIANCCVNEAGVEFDIDGIASINWSGMGTTLSEVETAPAATIDEGTSSTSNFIRNRLTALDVDTAMGGSHPATYNLVLTGGSVTISNNMTYLTPETLGVINTPLGHVTGTRTVSGSFSCYLNSEEDSSAELFENLVEDTSTITNSFDLTFHVGGNDATPGLQLHMPACHLEVPTHGIEDVISVETNFHALPGNIESADEISLIYKGA